MISVHACCWIHNRFLHLWVLPVSTSLFHFMGLFVSSCTVHTKWICTRPHVSTLWYLFVSFCVFSWPNWSRSLGFLQNYLVLVIVIWHDNRCSGSRRFICVHTGCWTGFWTQSEEKWLFFFGFAIDFSVHWPKSVWCLSLIFTFLFDSLWTLPFKFKLCPFLTIGILRFILSLH